MSPSNSKRRKSNAESLDEDASSVFASRKKSRNSRKKKEKPTLKGKENAEIKETSINNKSEIHSAESAIKSSSSYKTSNLNGNIRKECYTSKSLSKSLDLILTGDKRRGLYECDYCRRDISQLPRIRCAVCPDFDLCLDCFSTTDPNAANTNRSAAQAALALENPKDDSSGGCSSGDIYGTSASNKDNTNEKKRIFGDVTGKRNLETGFTIQHESSHGYRVADSTRFPLFPSTKSMGDRDKNTGDSRTSLENKTLSNSAHETKNSEEKNSKNLEYENKPSKEEEVFKEEFVEDMKFVWTVEEDLRLLDAISTLGLGNWVDISEAVSGNNLSGNGSGTKSAKRCMERYFDDYLGRFGHILPPYMLVEVDKENTNKIETISDAAKDETSTSTNGKRKKLRRSESQSGSVGNNLSQNNKLKKYLRIPTSSIPNYDKIWPEPYISPIGVQRGDEVGRDSIMRLEKSFVSAQSNTTTREEAEKLREEWIAKQNKKRLPKHTSPVLPPRLEDIRTMKGSELAGYMPRRGDFDVEYDNDAEHILADMEFSSADQPSERTLKLQIIKIYNSKLDERERRKRFLSERNLLDYRANKLTEDKLPPDERALIQRMRLFARFHSPQEHNEFLKNLLEAQKLRKRIANLQNYRRMGITSLLEAEAYELNKKRREHHKSAVIKAEEEEKKQEKILMLRELQSNSISAIGCMYGEKKVDRNRRRRNGLVDNDDDTEKKGEDRAKATLNEGDKTKVQMNVSSTQKDNDFDISKTPGIELLSRKEISLCQRLRLLPKFYLEAKRELIQLSLNAGMLSKKDKIGKDNSNILVKIDVEKRDGVIDFVMKSGWIAKKPT